MKVSTLRQISKFIDQLVNSGYDGNTSITTLLADMGFTTLPNNLINILTFVCIYEHNISQQSVTAEYRTICTMIASTDIEKLITISDELYITYLTNFIIKLNNPLPRTMNDYILNYDCDQVNYDDRVISAYNTGYKVLRESSLTRGNNNSASINILKNCIQNGLYIKNIRYSSNTRCLIDALSITDIEGISINFWHYQKNWDNNAKNLIGSNFKTIKSIDVVISDIPNLADVVSSLPSLETVKFYGNLLSNGVIPNDIAKYSSMTRKIKSLTMTHYILNDILCKLFGNVRELHIQYCHAHSNSAIPSTVKKLNIVRSDITDAMLSTCTKIKYLNILDVAAHYSITTCAPFGKTLKYLILHPTASIDDSGLVSCTNLKILHVESNDKITTCAPFARSLKKLYADCNSGIQDDGLKLCSKIVVLSANSNYKITTCDPFAKSLVELHASSSCGMNDDGLKLCSKLRILDAYNNDKIRTCEPFADSLETLNAQGLCGIYDGGLRLCSRLKYLNASCNPKITTCNSFAKTLLYLYADCPYRMHNGHRASDCGISDSGINLCTKLIKLSKDNNDRIRLRLPIIK